MPSHEDCMRDDDFKRLYRLVEKVFTRMDTFLDEIHKTNIAETNRENRIIVLERDVDRAFVDIRKNKDEIKTISDWRQRFEGGVKVMLAIPVLCTIITTCVALYKMMHP